MAQIEFKSKLPLHHKNIPIFSYSHSQIMRPVQTFGPLRRDSDETGLRCCSCWSRRAHKFGSNSCRQSMRTEGSH
jgi:hypothetical protein